MTKRLAGVLLVVFGVGLVHAGLYAVVFPPWAVEDEQQHVDYAWTIAHQRHLPRIGDPLAPSIVDSIWGTDRWSAYDFEVPSSEAADPMGLGGRSYMAYHPPAVYVMVAPVVWVVGDRALVAMYVLRAISALAAAGVCVLAALLAARLAPPDRARTAALVAGLAVALLPSVAEAGGRFNTDVFAALVVLLGVHALLRWTERPSVGSSWVVGGALAAAVVTRETTVVLVVPLVVAAVVLVRGRRMSTRFLAPVIVPVVAATAVVAVSARVTAGRVAGSEAFLDMYGPPFSRPGVPEAIGQLARRALLPYGDWRTPWPLVLLVAAVVGAGLVLAARRGLAVPAAVAAGMVVLQLLVLALTVFSGLSGVTGRLLLSSYPVAIAVAAVGWCGFREAAARWVVIGPVALLAGGFLVADLFPRYL